MTEKTAALLTNPHPSCHLVFPYDDEASFVAGVGLFVVAGLAQGDAVILVSTREHRNAIARRLVDEGFDCAEVERKGQLLTFDASGLLCDLFQADTPDPDTFKRMIGKMIDSARHHAPSGRVRIYGEMVNLLCGNNDIDAAANLEDLWNEAIEEHSVPLLCSYSMSMLPSHTGGSLPSRIVESHSHSVAA